jgi:flagellin-like protein
LQRLSPLRRRARTRGIAELYAALVLVAVTLSLSYVVFSQVRFPVRPQPIFVATMFEQYGSPSILRLLVNSSAPSSG